MRLLILGGTVFLGRHAANEALERGHEVALFNRGKSDPGLFPEAEHLRGDRETDLAALRRGRWDAVLDTSGFSPATVDRSAAVLADRVEHYTFVSSSAVYMNDEPTPAHEDSPTLPEPAGAVDPIRDYGPLKVACERAVAARMPGRVLAVRPGVIAGPLDPTDRLAYWIERVSGSNEFLAAGPSERRVQLIDVRDLAAWIVTMIEDRRTGVFNTVAEPISFGALLETCRLAVHGSAAVEWVDEEFLLRRRVRPLVDQPLWIPSAQGGFPLMNARRAVSAGLRTRSLEETARDMAAWLAREGRKPARALHEIRERELLRAWRARP